MARLGLERSVIDAEVLKRTAGRFRQAGVVLPTIAQLQDPSTIPAAVREKLRAVDPDAPHPLNLFRVHWFNDASRKRIADVPAFVELPEQLTGVKARIVLLLGNRFPMIRAHKVLAAYGANEALEGAPSDGVVLVEFPTADEARDWYNSPAYVEARAHRHLGADYRAVLFEGL